MGIVIRKCREDDLPAVASLMRELAGTASIAAELEDGDIAKIWRLMEGSPDHYLTFVAESQGVVVGAVTLLFYCSFLHQVGTAQINELVVAAGQRGKHIGEQLVQACKEEALQRGMDELEVGTEKENVAAQAFYRKLGFDGEYVLFGMEFSDQIPT